MHDSDDRHVVLDETDRDADRFEAVQEVGGAVERVDEPAERTARSSGFLTEDRNVGPCLDERSPHHGFAAQIGSAHPVARRLLAHLPRRAELLGDDRAAEARRVEGDREQLVELLGFHRRPADARRLASSSGVPAPSNWRRAATAGVTSS